MGQILRRLQEVDGEFHWEEMVVPRSCASEARKTRAPTRRKSAQFPDLTKLPPELSLCVLSYLNPTDLCLAACIWDGLANDEVLWMRQCVSSWRCVTIYNHCRFIPGFSYKQLFMLLDEASVTFNAEPEMGMEYLHQKNLVANDPLEIARFLHTTKRLRALKKREFLNQRRDVLEKLIELQSYENIFLPNALRQFFGEISAPTERGSYLEDMIDRFSDRFCACNPQLGLQKDTVYVLCFSLIMLSVDLCSPHVKNKMSKREFIRNTRQAAHGVNDDLAGHLYDNIYLVFG
ncbi:F-box only protein 8-like isoform X2 [Liolophura sinensis]|uniref:F-box only protein 8-like isoform X2 n=1 Tax=Liolophura sinensis TaxID=3198878 RepID=UPI0031593A7F